MVISKSLNIEDLNQNDDNYYVTLKLNHIDTPAETWTQREANFKLFAGFLKYLNLMLNILYYLK